MATYSRLQKPDTMPSEAPPHIKEHTVNTLYLGSGSPCRMEILTQLGYRVVKLPAGIDETVKAGETPAPYVQRMAEEKNQAALTLFCETNGAMPDFPLITADTCVFSDGIIIGQTSLPSRSNRIFKPIVRQTTYRPDYCLHSLSRQNVKPRPNQPRRFQAPEFGRNFRLCAKRRTDGESRCLRRARHRRYLYPIYRRQLQRHYGAARL